MRNGRIAAILALTALVLGHGRVFVSADETDAGATVSTEINEINDQIEEKKAHIDQIDRKIDEYRKQISIKEGEATSLQNEIELLDNRVATAELQVEATQETIDETHAEIHMLETQISEVETKLDKERGMLKALIQEIDSSDKKSLLETLLAHDSFSDLFDQLEYLDQVHADLQGTLASAKAHKETLETYRTSKEGKLTTLETLQTQLEKQVAELSDQKESKEVLVQQTRSSELQFSALLSDLRGEQQYIDQQIGALQSDIEEKLAQSDLSGETSSVISWPVAPLKGISTLFHDPSYPYRHLFEHSGIDIPTDVGTPVASAAPGYVAWTKTGTMYGYYVMVIHTNGLATLYAHLSKILVQPDQFVSRGDVIGLSGGRPGMPGAGLSTGPHLHFEVRKDGIPVDPLGYLPTP